MPKVHFVNETLTVDAKRGQTIQEVASAHGITLFRGFWSWANCRNTGLCGSCKVWARPSEDGALSAKGFLENIKPGVHGTIRLGCQAEILGDCEIRTKPAGPAVTRTTEWAPDPRPWKWKDRLTQKNAKDDEDEPQAASKS